jgi:hypothetical protein
VTFVAEIWKAVVGYEGQYEVSNLGRVRSVSRIASDGSRRRGYVLRPIAGGYRRQYHYVSLSRGSRAWVKQVHSLVLTAFVGPRKENEEACHGAAGPTDNRLSNLRWDTKKANSADAVAAGSIPTGARHWNAKLSDGCVDRVRDMVRCGVFQHRIGDWFNVSQSQISRIVLGLRWRT